VAVTATLEATSSSTSKPPPPPPPTANGVAKAAALAKVKSGRARVKLSCSGGPCTGTLKLTAKVKRGPGRRKTTLIGKAPFSLAAGASRTIKVKLSPARSAS
jgi:hypothetical protein